MARQAMSFLLSRTFSERFAYAFVAVAVIASKIIHIVAHERGLPRRHLALWAFSFVTQDLVLLLLVRYALDRSSHSSHNHSSSSSRRKKSSSNGHRVILRLATLAVMIYSAVVSVVNVAFFAYTRSEVHWRNAAFASDSSSRSVLMSGLAVFLSVFFAHFFLAAVLQSIIFPFAQCGVDIAQWPWHFVRHYRTCGPRYSQLPRTSSPDELSLEKGHYPWHLDSASQWRIHWAPRALWTVAILSEILALLVRPSMGSLTYISWTTPLLPFVDFKESASLLQGLQPVYHADISALYDKKTALDHPVPFDWLPRDTVLPGFEDWYQTDGKHYNAAADPLRISNLEEDVLLGLKDALSKVSIKHIMVVVLESTRKDVFPIKKDGLIWNRFAETYGTHEQLPDAPSSRLETLTQTAKHLTGDFQDGFPSASAGQQNKGRGGINFNNAFSSATYTLKSMVGIMCGVWPLVADLNQEYLHHIYQPCLPQVLEALTRIDDKTTTTTQDKGRRSKWQSHFLQSITLGFDHSDLGTAQFGFPRENIIDSRYLRSAAAKFGAVQVPDINYFGFEEPHLLDYMRDAFASARRDDARVLLTHVTSTTHHPYKMPANETVVPLGHGGRLEQMSDYINSVGYDDRWLGQILQLLDEEQVADETLVVFVGDHGISLPENDKPASYYNPNTGCNHVPLVFSHPRLPIMDVGGAEIMSNWQFIVMNPGRAMIGIRDKRRSHLTLVVPVIENVFWRFNDLTRDPRDVNPIEAFSFATFLQEIEKKYGKSEAEWAEEAAFVVRWFVDENNKRWQYGEYALPSNAKDS
ncbi:hypothetical protein LLEC1_06843 [Akanthomyces lecanii]|uniref:Sulfatase N-terminal domain-containing protein n=1 Tax=Cordyceps confragosa TaxID=2714763 RepID=A0A179IJP4_CORDF|nr:hypothetical protein LLEC1_06843 [Akanthomyces lecanii]